MLDNMNCFPGGGQESKSRCRKQHSAGKKKKKKRKKDEGNSSESDSAFVPKRAELKRQEELPDIIPKQVRTRQLHHAHNTNWGSCG